MNVVYCCTGHERIAGDNSKTLIREKQSFGRRRGGMRNKERELEMYLVQRD